MPPTTTATEPFFSTRLKLPRVAGTEPIHAMKWRHIGIEKTDEAATEKMLNDGQIAWQSVPAMSCCIRFVLVRRKEGRSPGGSPGEGRGGGVV